jgi:hypothetical protein
MLEVPRDGDSRDKIPEEGKEPTLDILNASTRSPTNTFVQARPKTIRNGTSIRDHPSTWDLESDQLADELAALAMEFDPELQDKVKAAPPTERPTPPPDLQDVAKTTRDREDPYIYETYVRMPYDGDPGTTTNLQSNYGILVIDEEDEDLWQKYVDSEDETDWDDEDSNGELRTFNLSIYADTTQPRTTPPMITQKMKSPPTMSLVIMRTNIALMGPTTRNSTTNMAEDT